jgi:(p)ppGpp synthase/HD superfamily hydrolase
VSTELILRAAAYAERVHRGQPRKYTGEPYIVHPVEVAHLVATVNPGDEVVAAALLHDVVEDCGITVPQLIRAFGERVGHLVYEVTDRYTKENFPEFNREKRKWLEVQRIAKIPAVAKVIKLADMISNTQSIMLHDPDFAKVYMPEKRAMLDVLSEASPPLYLQALGLVQAWEARQAA